MMRADPVASITITLKVNGKTYARAVQITAEALANNDLAIIRNAAARAVDTALDIAAAEILPKKG